MSETLRTQCPGCDSTLKVSEKYWGKTVKCPKCGELLAIPMPSANRAENTPNPAKDRPRTRTAASGILSRSDRSGKLARVEDSPSLSSERRKTSRQTSQRRSSDPTGASDDLDWIDEAEDFSGLDNFEDYEADDEEDYEDYEDYDAEPSPKKKMSKPTTVDTSVRGVWRDGSVLVVAHGAKLPKRCIKTNERGFKKKHQELSYTHPMVYIIQLPLILVMAVFAGGYVVFHRSRKAELDVYYSKNWVQKRKKAIYTGLGILVAGIVLFILTIMFRLPLLALVGFFCFFGGLIYACKGDSLVAKKIDENYIRLRGAGKPFLDSLPDWRKNRQR